MKKTFAQFCIFLLLVCWGCKKDQMVPFAELNSCIEVSKNSDSTISFRAFVKPNSYQSITEPVLKTISEGNSRTYCLVLLYGPYATIDSKSFVKKMPWGGIKVVFQGGADLSKDKFYYIDGAGKHKINLGTLESWKKKIDEVLDQNNIEKELRGKFYSDI